MEQSKLFEDTREQRPLSIRTERDGGKPRLRVAVRDQIVMRTLALDQMLPEDDEARLVWDFVCQADLSPLHTEIQAVQGVAGRNANDPRILLSLWLYATIKGVGSARELARLCERHLAYQWICGDVSMNYHTLADFRVCQGALVDRLLTEQLAVLMQAGAVKLADGGTRPAYNVQFATDTSSQVIVGVEVITEGSDAGQLEPMQEQIEDQTENRPQKHLADGGFSTIEELEKLNDPGEGRKLYVPVKNEERKRKEGKDPFLPRAGDTPAVAEWRQRMGTPEAKQIYRERAATAEWVNAQARNRGLQQFRVRGLSKVRIIAVWYALAHNVLRMAALRAVVKNKKS